MKSFIETILVATLMGQTAFASAQAVAVEGTITATAAPADQGQVDSSASAQSGVREAPVETIAPQAGSTMATDTATASSPPAAVTATVDEPANTSQVAAVAAPQSLQQTTQPAEAESVASPAIDSSAGEEPIGPLSLGVAFAALNRTDDGMRMIDGQSPTPQVTLLGGYDAELAGGFRLGGELSWGIAYGSNDNYLGTSLASHALEHRALLAAILSAPLHPRICPHLRVAGGMSAAKVHIDHDASHAGLDDWLLAPMAEVTAGFTLHWPVDRDAAGHGRKFHFGIRIEGGYALSQNRDVQLAGDSGRQISTALASLGKLNASGALFRLSLVLRL